MSEIQAKFITATRHSYRWIYKGLITVEDLWDLTPNALDEIYSELMERQENKQRASLQTPKNKESKELQIKINIVKYIYETLQEEKEKAQNAVARKQQKQRLLELRQQKADDKLAELSVEDLDQMISEL